jgi:hypothetical protein
LLLLVAGGCSWLQVAAAGWTLSRALTIPADGYGNFRPSAQATRWLQLAAAGCSCLQLAAEGYSWLQLVVAVYS